MLSVVSAVLVLVVGISLVVAIVLNRLAPHVGFALLKTAIKVRLPLSEAVDWEFKVRGKPKRVVLSFKRSLGFYSGSIVVKNGSATVGGCELPVRPEYTNKSLRFYNEDISRQTNVASLRIWSYAPEHPLTLALNLDQNVRDPDLKRKLNLSDDEEIGVVIFG